MIHCHQFAPVSESASQDEASEVTDTGNSRVTQRRGMGECCGVALFCLVGFRASVSDPACVWRMNGTGKVDMFWITNTLLLDCASPFFFFDCCPLKNATDVQLICCMYTTERMTLSQNKENPGEEVGLPVCVSVSRLTQVHRNTAQLVSEVT